MAQRIRCLYAAFALVALCVVTSTAQHSNRFSLSGIVYDSATALTIPFVTVFNETSHAYAATDDKGNFSILASPGDTVMFTMLGYSKKKRIVGVSEFGMIIFLKEFAFTLQPVTIYSSFKPHGSDEWTVAMPKPRTFYNAAGAGSNSGYAIQTVGVGISISGLISRFSKSEKELRKVAALREKTKSAEGYVGVITSDETKTFFKKTFSMTDSEYGSFIYSFNVAHPEAASLKDKEEIVNALVAFKATKK